MNEAIKCNTLGARYDRGSYVDVSNASSWAVMFSASVYKIVHQLPYAQLYTCIPAHTYNSNTYTNCFTLHTSILPTLKYFLKR